MNSERKTIAKSILGSVIIAILIFVLLISFAPDSTPYSVNNYGWNGLHEVGARFAISSASSFSDVPVSNRTALLLIDPSVQISSSSAAFLQYFVSSGGTLIIAGGSRFVNPVLTDLGAHIQIQDSTISDPLYNWKSPNFPIGLVVPSAAREFSFLENVTGVALTNPSPLSLSSGSAVALANSSPLSVSTNENHTAHGPFVLIAAEKVGGGLVIVFGDPNFLTNSVWANGDNQALFTNLFGKSSVYLDTSHWPANTATSLKAHFVDLYDQFSSGVYRYFLSLGFIALGVILTTTFTDVLTVRARKAEPGASTLNNEILSRVRRDREKYGVKTE